MKWTENNKLNLLYIFWKLLPNLFNVLSRWKHAVQYKNDQFLKVAKKKFHFCPELVQVYPKTKGAQIFKKFTQKWSRCHLGFQAVGMGMGMGGDKLKNSRKMPLTNRQVVLPSVEIIGNSAVQSALHTSKMY